MRRLIFGLVLSVSAAAVVASPAQPSLYFPVDELRPGMVGVGRTVFAGNTLEEFRATIIGVLRNVLGPQRDLILARLEGGPLANTGVIQGMSGSPVYVGGRLLGAVSYSLGSFPKEPIAGITPIGEMIATADPSGPRPPAARLRLDWPATQPEIFAALSLVAARAAAPLGHRVGDVQVIGPASLADLAPALRPIGAAMIMSGFDPVISRDVRTSLSIAESTQTSPFSAAETDRTLRPGDPVGMALVRGDLELGATGTVTHVDGPRVYAFGHPFLNLGPTSFAMTKAHVFTVLPSLESSIKIAGLGPVVGTITQDRATAVAGLLGSVPPDVRVHVSLNSARTGASDFHFNVVRDPDLTPLFTYVAVLNTLASYERQNGVLSVTASGRISFGREGDVVIDDTFSGPRAASDAAGTVLIPIGRAMGNDFRTVMAETIDVTFTTSEVEQGTTIERAWLDTARPRPGDTCSLQVQLQDFRGGKRVVRFPITMPAQASGPLTIFVGGGTALTQLEDKDLQPGHPTSWPELLADLKNAKRGNRLYVRLISTSPGAVVGGETLPALPASVRSILDADTAVDRAPVARTVIGAWEQRLDVAVRGSHELTFVLTPRR